MTGGGAGAQTPTLPPSLSYLLQRWHPSPHRRSLLRFGRARKQSGRRACRLVSLKIASFCRRSRRVFPWWGRQRRRRRRRRRRHVRGFWSDAGADAAAHFILRRGLVMRGCCCCGQWWNSCGCGGSECQAPFSQNVQPQDRGKGGTSAGFALKVSQNKKSGFFFSLINKSLTHQKKMSVNYDFCVVEKKQQFCDRLPMDFIYPFKQ